MSNTPRTDAEIVQFGDGPAKYVYAAFASELERENNELRKYKERMEWLLATYDVVELVKDQKRLDWILSDAGNYWLSSREDIDKEMEEAKWQLVFSQ